MKEQKTKKIYNEDKERIEKKKNKDMCPTVCSEINIYHK